MNYKILIIVAAFFTLSGLLLSNVSYADVLPPKKQIEIKISSINVTCKQGLVKVIKAVDDKPSCVKPSTAEKLEKLGWAKQIDPKIIETVKMRIQSPPLGEVKTLAVVKQVVNTGRLNTAPPTNGYNFIFEACAFDKTIRAPQVLVNSDSESKQIQLATMISANTCQASAVIIKAAEPSSIKGTLTNKGKITDKITTLENNIKDLQKQIDDEKKMLAQVIESDPSHQMKEKVSQSSKKIIELRSQLNQAKGAYNTYLYALHVDSKSLSQFKKPLDFEGAKIPGVTISTVTSYQQVDSTVKPFGYNVLFKVCSDETTIRVPQVKITSDVETQIVNMADKIPVRTCQQSIGKIKANNVENITYELGTTLKVSSNISDIQTSLDSQQVTLAKLKEELSQLTRVAQKPFDFEEQVSDLTNQIVDLRNKINANKAQLAQYNFQFNQ